MQSEKTLISAPVNVVVSTPWTNAHKIHVLCAIDQDQKTNELNGRDDLDCPCCGTKSIKYRRTSIFDMVAWCSQCKTGIKQGNGSC